MEGPRKPHAPPTIQRTIDTLEAFDKLGESYADAHGRFGWRNPIREDTGELLYGLTLASRPQRLEYWTSSARGDTTTSTSEDQ